MIFNFPDNLQYPSTICSLSGSPIENVIQYDQVGLGEEEIMHRMAAAIQLFNNINIFCKILKSIIQLDYNSFILLSDPD